MNHIELFSGIGGFRQAMALIQQDHGVVFNCLGYSEIDEKARNTYQTNYDTQGEMDMGDVVTFNKQHDDFYLNHQVDLLTGGFPCQSFSMMGKQLGFQDERGQMFFHIYHILQIKHQQGQDIPFVLLENVRNLFTHDHGRTYRIMKGLLEHLGYHVYADVFNASAFRQAQTRRRALIFATTQQLPENVNFTFDNVKRTFDENYVDSWSIFNQMNVLNVLDTDVGEKYYLSEKIKPTILADGSGNYNAKSEINLLIARPLTATMTKMHRASQDNYYSDGFLHADDPTKYVQQIFSKEELIHQRIRKLTPEEAFNLQGFPKEFAIRARAFGVANGSLYKQAGNAVSVNMIYAALYYLFINQIIR